MKDLISPSTRGQFRQLMTDSTIAAISAAFHDAGFAPNPDCTYDDSSVRRTATQEYLEAVDYPGTGIITSPADHSPLRPLRALATLTDPTAIQEQLDRIQRAVIDDPALAIGSAKELIESTAKCVLIERGRPVNDKDDLPALARAAQEALGLHPSAVTPGPDGSDAVKKILGAVSPSPTAWASSATAATAPGTAQSVCTPGTRTSPSTPPSPGASSCWTPSPTPKPHGTRTPDRVRAAGATEQSAAAGFRRPADRLHAVTGGTSSSPSGCGPGRRRPW